MSCSGDIGAREKQPYARSENEIFATPQLLIALDPTGLRGMPIRGILRLERTAALPCCGRERVPEPNGR